MALGARYVPPAGEPVQPGEWLDREISEPRLCTGVAAVGARRPGRPEDYHHYWVAAAADLNEGVAAHVPGTSGYPRAASELLKLVHLPFVVNTPVQMQAGAAALFEALNSFF